LSKVTGAASRTTVLNDHGKHNPIAEVADFLNRSHNRKCFEVNLETCSMDEEHLSVP
jgi:hypothetical protein